MSWLATYTPGFAFFGQPYEAGTLVQDVRHFAQMVNGEKPEPFKYEAVTRVEQLDWLLKEPWFALDIETAAEHPDRGWTGKDPTRALLKMVGFGTDTRCCSIIWGTASADIKRRVAFLLASSAYLKVLQNGPWFDNRVLKRYGMKVRRFVDTRDMRRSQSSTSRLGLGYMGSIYTLTDNWKAKDSAEDEDGKVVFTKDMAKLGKYNGQDCIITSRVAKGLWKEPWGAREQRLYEVHRDLSTICAEMHTTGIHVNHTGRNFMLHLLKQSIEEKSQLLTEMVGVPGWYPSPDNMRAIIYKRHERKVRLTEDTLERTTRKGRAFDSWFKRFSLPDPGNPRMYADDEMETISVDEPSLLLLLVSGDCPPDLVPIIDAWWNYQQDTKRMGYLDSYLIEQAIGADGRLRPSWNSCGTDTMRFSCSEPNVQNIEQMLRELFAPAPGNCIIHADKAQLEIRVMEAVANDRALNQAIVEGDVYSFDARRWFRLPPDFNVKKLKPAARKAAKIIHLGRQYRAGLGAVYAQALLQDRSFTFERTRLLCKEFDETYSDTVHYWNAEMAMVMEKGYSEGCILQGRRGYPAPPEPSEVANYPIQRTAAEMMNLEIIELWKRLRKEVPTARIMGQYHDAIEVECTEKLEQKVTRIVEDVMNRKWEIRGRTRDFPVEIKTCRSSEGGTVADV